MILDRERQTLRLAASRGLPEEASRVEIQVGEGVAGRVVQHGEPVVLGHDHVGVAEGVDARADRRARGAEPQHVGARAIRHAAVEDLVRQEWAEAGEPHPQVEIANFYENALRVLGGWIDAQRPRDVFFFEQEGSFVFRMLVATATSSGHQLAEFTKDEIVGMIEAAPQQRESAPEAGAKP